ncbi:hypothetical protein ACRQ1B_00355 [Rhizobium panacihumi]|uniref:hypothetical protein n=1 Tax=Rhizobium panacihumi TaxID=2008450 RepID=UPI003D7B5973
MKRVNATILASTGSFLSPTARKKEPPGGAPKNALKSDGDVCAGSIVLRHWWSSARLFPEGPLPVVPGKDKKTPGAEIPCFYPRGLSDRYAI